MLIQCPECFFERELNPEKIPPSAHMATCPRCNKRFKFRDVPQIPAHEEQPETETAEQTEQGQQDEAINEEQAAAEVARQERLRLPTEQEGDDPLPPRAVVVPKTAATDAGERAEARGAQAKQDANREQADSPNEPYGQDGQDRQQKQGDIPWELPQYYGIFGSLYHTILRVLFAAPRFYAELPYSQSSLVRPAIFYVLIGTVQAMVERMWFVSRLEALSAMGDANAQAGLAALSQNMSFGVLLVSMPFILLLQWLVYAGLFNLMVHLVQPDRANFEISLRIVAYSAAPAVVSIVPWAGSFTAVLWFAVCCFMGVKYALGLSWSRTALAVLPLYVLSFALGMHLVKMLLAG